MGSCPARHSIDVLADIQMRTLFSTRWLAREERSTIWPAEFVCGYLRYCIRRFWRCSSGDDPERTELLIRLAMLNCTEPRIPRPSFRSRTSALRRAATCARRLTGPMRSRPGAASRHLGGRTLSRLSASETHSASRAVPARTDRGRNRAAFVDGNISVKQLAFDLGYASFPAFARVSQVPAKTPTEFAEKQ